LHNSSPPRRGRNLFEINDGARFSRRAGLIARQLCPVFMWCRKLDVGAHHPCWLLLQALFMTASVIRRAASRIRASHLPGQIASKNPAGAVLPHRKRSADIIGRCGKYTEGQAAANQGEQHGRFHAVDLLPVDVKLVCEVGHGYSPCNTLPRPFAINLTL
jgi:hypothetical protein